MQGVQKDRETDARPEDRQSCQVASTADIQCADGDCSACGIDFRPLRHVTLKSKTDLAFCGQGGMRRLAVTIRQTRDCSVD